jgi:glycine oxidase
LSTDVEYIIVGSGLAGICFAEQLRRKNTSFLVISDESQCASEVAGGLYNPLILKRFTLAYNAAEQLDYAMPFYEELATFLKVEIDHKIPTLRILNTPAEQNTWYEARDKRGYERFMKDSFESNSNEGIQAPHQLAEVLETGKLDTSLLRSAYKSYLKNQGQLLEQRFDYGKLQLRSKVQYNAIQAKHIVFSEGYGLKQNPYFNYLPLNGTKGELLLIHCPGLGETRVIKSGVFMIPVGDDFYRVGATYKWKDKTSIPTEESKQELIEKLKKFLKVPFEVVGHVAGVRPTVTDRKPLLGTHPSYPNCHVFNGMGSRGVMIGPLASKQLISHIEDKKPLPEEISIDRFRQLWSPQDHS